MGCGCKGCEYLKCRNFGMFRSLKLWNDDESFIGIFQYSLSL
jgi:hypothetical protein